MAKRTDSREPVCPYCRRPLEQQPRRKTKCPHCGNLIHVLTTPSTREAVLATAEEAQRTESDRDRAYLTRRWHSILGQHAFTERDLDPLRRRGREKPAPGMSHRDAVWAMLNGLVTKISDLQSLKTIYYEMAIFLHAEGEDAFPVLQQSRKADLMHYRESGVIKKVEVAAADDNACEVCRRLEGQIFTVEEALDKMPIPCRECTHKLGTPGDEKGGFCRCTYIGTIEMGDGTDETA